MTWYRIPDGGWREGDNGVSVRLSQSNAWRFVDLGDVFPEANFDWGWCGWSPCNVLYLTPTTNTLRILTELGFDIDVTDLPITRYNAGRPQGTSTTTTGLSIWEWLPAVLVIGFALWITFRYPEDHLNANINKMFRKIGA